MSLDLLHEPDATHLVDGIVMVRSRGQLHPLRLAGRTVRSFAPGWHACALSHLLAPLLLLEFEAETGEHGLWLLDRDFNHLHASLLALPEAVWRAIALTLRPILDWLAGGRLGDGQPAPVAAFLSLRPGLRRDLEMLCRVVPGLPDRAALDERALDIAPTTPPADLAMPVHQLDDSSELAIGRTGLVVLQDDRAAMLSPGWRALRVSVLAFPTLILQLRHEDGTDAVWYLDHAGRFIGPDTASLHFDARRELARAIRPLFGALWHTLLIERATTLPAELAHLLALPEMIRLDLLALALDGRAEAGVAFPTEFCALDRPLPRALGYVARTATGQVALDPDHLRTACLQPLRDSFIARLLDGDTSWPSPVDGVRIRTTLQPLHLDSQCVAYELHDARHGLTFHVVAIGARLATVGIYLPGSDLFFVADQEVASRTRRSCADFMAMMLNHLTVYGASIARGRAVTGPLVHALRGGPRLRAGHHPVHELAGLDALVAALPPGKLPHCLQFDSGMGAEPYGPIEQIFPVLAGRVIRRRTRFEASIRTFYETGTQVMTAAMTRVPRSIGTRVMAAIDRDPLWVADRDAAADVPTATPVILLGLQLGDRTLADPAEFCVRLVAELARLFADAPPVIVLDGHHAASDDRIHRDIADNLSAAAPFIENERATAALVAAGCRKLGIRLVDLVGQPVARSLIWCRRAQFFVAPWGPALAEYRWICNTPGLAMTGHRTLLERRDLDIYHHPALVESPSELIFVPPEHVADVPVEGGPADRADFVVDETAAFALVRRLVETYCPQHASPEKP